MESDGPGEHQLHHLLLLLVLVLVLGAGVSCTDVPYK